MRVPLRKATFGKLHLNRIRRGDLGGAKRGRGMLGVREWVTTVGREVAVSRKRLCVYGSLTAENEIGENSKLGASLSMREQGEFRT